MASVTKRYGSITAVDDLTIEVETGEVLGLLGPNGAGKSTTLCMLTGLVWPTDGAINIFGKELRHNFVDIASRFGVLLERPTFCDYLSVRRNMKLHARLTQREININRVLDLAGILHLAEMKAGALSQGMRQRLGLAQAMLTEPDLLILDEPTSGLDVESSREVLRFLRRLADEANVTVVISSHLMHEVETLCDRVAILNQGKLIAYERTDALISYDPAQVEVLLEGVEGAAKRLSPQPWVKHVEVRSKRLIVHLRDANSHQLNSFLINAGYQVTGLIPRRRTLQDYFIKVMNS